MDHDVIIKIAKEERECIIKVLESYGTKLWDEGDIQWAYAVAKCINIIKYKEEEKEEHKDYKNIKTMNR